MMRRLLTCVLLVLAAAPATAGAAELIVRPRGNAAIETICARYGWELLRRLDKQRLFLVHAPDDTDWSALETQLATDQEISRVEWSQPLALPRPGRGTVAQSIATILEANGGPALTDYHGEAVWDRFASQPALALTNTADAQALAVGTGTVVAIIDTGVDPDHPALRNALLEGYDFTRSRPGASEWPDLAQSIATILEQSIATILEQSIATILEGNAATNGTVTGIDPGALLLEGHRVPEAFGHGTMVAGVVRLVAPRAQILPLKAFNADGTSTLFDIIRAVYYAADHGADVINLSFTVPYYSDELWEALAYAQRVGAVSLAAIGNGGQETDTYPALFREVIGIGATDLLDQRAAFSNYGDEVDVAAPGDLLITTYPGGRYAQASGTSFSTPFVSGTVAILTELEPGLTLHSVQKALNHAKKLDRDLGLGAGRLDVLASARSIKISKKKH